MVYDPNNDANANWVMQKDPTTGLPIAPAGTDSNGNALPANFDSKGSVVVETGGTTTQTKTIGAATYTRTITVVGSTTTTSDWIAS